MASPSYVFNILKVAGTFTALGIVGFFAYLVVSAEAERNGVGNG